MPPKKRTRSNTDEICQRWPNLQRYLPLFRDLLREHSDHEPPTVEDIEWLCREAEIHETNDRYFAIPLLWFVQYYPWFYWTLGDNEAKSRLEVGELMIGTSGQIQPVFAELIKSSKQENKFSLSLYNSTFDWIRGNGKGAIRMSEAVRRSVSWHASLMSIFRIHEMTKRGFAKTSKFDYTQNNYIKAVTKILDRFPGLQMKVSETQPGSFVQVHPKYSKYPFGDREPKGEAKVKPESVNVPKITATAQQIEVKTEKEVKSRKSSEQANSREPSEKSDKKSRHARKVKEENIFRKQGANDKPGAQLQNTQSVKNQNTGAKPEVPVDPKPASDGSDRDGKDGSAGAESEYQGVGMTRAECQRWNPSARFHDYKWATTGAGAESGMDECQRRIPSA